MLLYCNRLLPFCDVVIYFAHPEFRRLELKTRFLLVPALL